MICGHVDSGKSTTTGRLIFELGGFDAIHVDLCQPWTKHGGIVLQIPTVFRAHQMPRKKRLLKEIQSKLGYLQGRLVPHGQNAWIATTGGNFLDVPLSLFGVVAHWRIPPPCHGNLRLPSYFARCPHESRLRNAGRCKIRPNQQKQILKRSIVSNLDIGPKTRIISRTRQTATVRPTKRPTAQGTARIWYAFKATC